MTAKTMNELMNNNNGDNRQSGHSGDVPVQPGMGWSNGQMETMMYPQSGVDGRVKLYQKTRRTIQTATSWSRTGNCDPNDPVAASTITKSIITDPTQEGETVKALMSQLCEKFYGMGWQSGTGGGISIRIGEGTKISPYRVFSTPSGIQKEDMVGDDVFEMDMDENVVHIPKTPGLKLSSMTPLWFIVYRLRPKTKCVIHTHSMNAQLATLLDTSEQANELRITHLEMIKGVGGHAYDDVLTIPIIKNMPSENLLGPDLEVALKRYPKCNAVLVRRHGVYVWGESWEQAKTQLECFDYVFETAIKMKTMGIDCSAIPRPVSNDVVADLKQTRDKLKAKEKEILELKSRVKELEDNGNSRKRSRQ